MGGNESVKSRRKGIKNPGRITKILRQQDEKFNRSELKFPVKVKDISKFEINNEINLCVYSYDDESRKVYHTPQHITGFDKLKENKLLPKKEFHGELNNTDISDEETIMICIPKQMSYFLLM